MTIVTIYVAYIYDDPFYIPVVLMEKKRRVAVITGGNKGIGYATVRGIAKQFDGEVILTSRNESYGLAAVKKLEEEDNVMVQYHQLDIENVDSICKLRDFLLNNYGGLDILVNNAGVSFKDAEFSIQAEVNIKTNFYGVRNTCDILFPLLKPGARVVNLASSSGWLSKKIGGSDKGDALKEKFASSGTTLTFNELSNLMNTFIALAKEDKHLENGWPRSAYAVSKIGLSALTRIQQQEFDQDPSKDLVVNHAHPGWVGTDLTKYKGPLTIDEGAKSSIYCALLPPQTEVKGCFVWEDCSIADWVNG